MQSRISLPTVGRCPFLNPPRGAAYFFDPRCDVADSPTQFQRRRVGFSPATRLATRDVSRPKSADDPWAGYSSRLGFPNFIGSDALAKVTADLRFEVDRSGMQTNHKERRMRRAQEQCPCGVSWPAIRLTRSRQFQRLEPVI